MNIRNVIKSIKFRILLSYFLLLVITGCISNPTIETMTSEQRNRASDIVVIESFPPKNTLNVLTTVKGISCKRNAYSGKIVNKEEAIQGVILKQQK